MSWGEEPSQIDDSWGTSEDKQTNKKQKTDSNDGIGSNNNWGSGPSKDDDAWGSTSTNNDDGWGSTSAKNNDGWASSENGSRGGGGYRGSRGFRGGRNNHDSHSRNSRGDSSFDRNDNYGSRGRPFNRGFRGGRNNYNSSRGEASSNGDDGWTSGNNNEKSFRSSRDNDPWSSNNNSSRGGGSSNDGWASGNNNSERVNRRPRDHEKDSSWKQNKNGSDDSGGWASSNAEDGGWANSNAEDGGWSSTNEQSNKRPRRNDNSDWGDKKPRTEDRGSSYDSGDNKSRGQTDDHNEERPAPFKPEEINLEEEAKLQDDAAENFYHQKEIKVTCIPKGQFEPINSFEEVIKSELLLKNIELLKYKEMSPIQRWAIPAIANGIDLIACAQTGSGKTAAFLLPVLQTLLNTELESNDPNDICQNPYCLIISPTRELANQIYVQTMLLSRDSIIKSHVIYGQISSIHLRSKLSTGCHILVATPGKLKDFVEKGWIGFKNIKYIILDEGDRLVGDSFKDTIDFFMKHPTMSPQESRQVLFFSATFHKDIQLIATSYLANFVILTVGKIGAANEDIKQEFIQTERQNKKRELKKILSEIPEEQKTIVFTQTKTAADMLAGFLNVMNLSCTSIHGDRHQSQREQAITAFRRGEKRFLISSPVGNRGLDLPKVSLVINYDLPAEIDEYVHRIGRTGRAGHTGRAISFYDATRDSDLLKDLIPILKEAKQEIPDWMSIGISDNLALSTFDDAAQPNDNSPQNNDNPIEANDTAIEEVW